jgi:pyrroline-5-carboxylate reductase
LARVVRVMPNMPCQIGAGMSAIALGDGAKPRDESLAVSIFGALGRTAMVDESLIHAATAVSGSGPAYLFLLAEAMERAAMELGIDQATARLMVEQTIMGAGRLMIESGQDAANLRQAVTSPGGTTAAALEVFEQRQFIDVVIAALTAARDRGKQLDRQ